MRQETTRIQGDEELLRMMRRSEAYDKQLRKAIEEVKRGGPRALQKDMEDWDTEEGLILFRGKVYVPKDPELRHRVVALHHDTLPTGHPGRWKTYELLSCTYWWPGMSVFVEKYVTGCEV